MKVRVRRRTAAVVAVVLVPVGVAAVMAAGGTASRHQAAPSGPIKGQVHTIGLRDTSTTADLTSRSTVPFSLLEVVWDAARTKLNGPGTAPTAPLWVGPSNGVDVRVAGAVPCPQGCVSF
jgi:hypothetical protein